MEAEILEYTKLLSAANSLKLPDQIKCNILIMSA